MSQHNIHTLHVLWDNTLIILSGILAWTLTLLGVDVHHIGTIFTGGGWEVFDWALSHAAVLLSCAVSLATLFKIKKEIKKQKEVIMAEVTTSKQFRLNLQDLGKGALVSAVAAGLTGLYTILSSGATPTIDNLKSIGLVALTSGVAYLVKNFFTPEQVITQTK